MLYNQLFVENIKTFVSVLFWFSLKTFLRRNFLANIHAWEFLMNILSQICGDDEEEDEVGFSVTQNNGNNFGIFHIDSRTCRLIIIQSFFHSTAVSLTASVHWPYKIFIY